MRTDQAGYSIVVPTVARSSLATLIARLGMEASWPANGPEEVVVVDDRTGDQPLLSISPIPPSLQDRLRIIRTGGRGPAAARNAGWRAVASDWVVFLDDDVVPLPGWGVELERELAEAPPGTAAVQAEVVVPLPEGRPPADWERDVAGLQGARWITADLAYRRGVLREANGFDERFPRAYREDTELALRVSALGYGLLRGRRRTLHPVRPASWWVSVARQRGNADDALLRRLHGAGWRHQAGVGSGRRPRHAVVAATGLVGALLLAGRRTRSLAWGPLALWTAGTAELAWARIKPGPRTAREVASMVATSIALPFCAVAWYLIGAARARRWEPLCSQRPPPGRGGNLGGY
jgi:hypothetical protein